MKQVVSQIFLFATDASNFIFFDQKQENIIQNEENMKDYTNGQEVLYIKNIKKEKQKLKLECKGHDKKQSFFKATHSAMSSTCEGTCWCVCCEMLAFLFASSYI
ncbi:unnamed protein product [Ilex paraguariensis]|uniref:Uncharacterized protein n=1 Tax=Ilex paraguariensis TaxID=185542 RepID=A0ABC8V4U9_9AQUA